MEAVSLRTDVYNNAAIKQILEANPDELRNPGLQDFLYAEFAQSFVDSILLQQTQQTARTNREAQLGDHKLEIHLAANQLIKHELADTSSLNYTDYRTWLYKKESPAASYERVLSYMMTGDTTRAKEVQDSIPLLFDLTTAQDTEHDYFEDLLDLVIEAYGNEVGYRDYDSTTVAELETIADNSVGLPGAMTRNLLNRFYGYNYTFSPQTIIEERQAHSAPVHYQEEQSEMESAIRFIPNPASSQLIVQYDFKEKNETPALLKAYDVNGRLVDQLLLDGQNGRTLWDVSSLERGVYYSVIERGTTFFEPKKLVLID